ELRTLSRSMLEADGRFAVVGVATDGDEAVDLVAENRPDLALIDLAMPGSDGFEAIARLRQVSPETKVVVLTGLPSEQVRDRVASAGAHACLEKGTSYRWILLRLAELCSGPDATSPSIEPRPSMASVATDGVAAEVDGAPLATAATSADASMRKVRWLGAVFAFLQFALYEPPPGLDMPFSQLVVGAAVATWLVAVNAVSVVAGRRLTADSLARWRVVELVADAATVLAVVWLFSFDPTSALWALLVVPVLQGAKRAGLRGAMLTWGGLSVGYFLRELWAAQTYDYHRFEVASVTYRTGIVALVAVAAGTLARQLTELMVAHARAAGVARHRARLLRSVVTASRAMGSVDADKVLAAVLDGAISLGFEAVEVCVFEDPTGAWRTVASRGMPLDYRGGSDDGPGGVAAKVWATADAVVVEDYSAWADGVPRMRAAGFGMVVAVPIVVGEQLVATLIAGRRESGPPASAEVECLTLLAAQAGVAMRNASFVEEIGQQAFRDALTGLPNRLLFEDRLRVAIAKASRRGEVVAVLFIDIDRFKEVNDVLGHDIGNRLLQQVAGRLLASVRAADTVARVGGDEFAVALDGLRDCREAKKVADAILEAASKPVLIGPHSIDASLSIGLASYPVDGTTHEELLRRADARMYEMKAAGRRLDVAGDARRGGPVRTHLREDLRRALDEGVITVAYQPQVDLTTGAVVGIEALARWRDPAVGAVEPSQFIPVAEEGGLISRVDLCVLERACEQAQQWRAEGFPELRLAVNLSTRDLRGDVVTGLAEILQRTQFPAAHLEVELTESWSPRDTERLRGDLMRLKDLGLRLALDDFGTGCANIAELRSWPIDTLKIDGSLVAGMQDSGRDRAILEAIMLISGTLGLRTVAEHVETPEQLALLRERGCDIAQGYLFAPALTAAEVAVRLPLQPAAGRQVASPAASR
ncbi:MAG TPA: EAL domain-containing protein, partial [Nitriliruptorales bacterium]|nr:EAL domain-containing protein [Nitriliruptorales bacterium]